MPSIPSTLLSLCTLLAGYLTARCITDPSSKLTSTTTTSKSKSTVKAKAKITDRIYYLTTTPAVLGTYFSVVVTLYQSLITLFSSALPSAFDEEVLSHLLLYPSHLNPSRVSWNISTISSLSLIFVGAAIRLSAYGNLGRNFTFQLSTPDRLITDGVYAYLQHPSYTGLLTIGAGCAGFFGGRGDGAIFCLVPGGIVGLLREWELFLGILAVVGSGVVIGVRIRDEERMLKGRFGRRWEEWHARTARLVPFVM
ncbi:methyltransferase family protein [Aspergillus stella-maris]|uniref:methyltransferase family protein n=1 Tax=Aspergillus stella-maris TaxID=1810926 RepID=UPI003CCD3803